MEKNIYHKTFLSKDFSLLKKKLSSINIFINTFFCSQKKLTKKKNKPEIFFNQKNIH